MPGVAVQARIAALSAISDSSAFAAQPLMTATSTAASIRRAIRTGEYEWPLQLLAQSLADLRRVAEDPGDRRLYLAPPGGTGSREWNALIAGAVARECRRLGIEPPAWTNIQPLPQGWSPLALPGLRRYLVEHTPEELARLGVWLDAGSLDAA